MALIIPEVFADAVNAKLNASLRIGRVAFNATPDVSEAMKYGDTIHFPKLNRVVTASEVTKGTPMTPAEVDMPDMSASIKQVGASARVYDKEAAQIKGRVMDEMVRQVADAMATKVDGDLVVAMDTDAVYKHASASATAITSSELDEAMNSFGDDVDTSKFAGIIINSRLRSSFMAMDAFTNVQKTFNLAEQANGIALSAIMRESPSFCATTAHTMPPLRSARLISSSVIPLVTFSSAISLSRKSVRLSCWLPILSHTLSTQLSCWTPVAWSSFARPSLDLPDNSF